MVPRRIVLGVAIGAVGLLGALAPATAAPSECPEGWFVTGAPAGDPYDDNGDGRICTKDIPGQGDGNSANSQRPPGQTGFHVDGHNHKDNKV